MRCDGKIVNGTRGLAEWGGAGRHFLLGTVKLTHDGRFDTVPDLSSAGVAQLVERNLAKVEADGSSPFTRSNSPHELEGLWQILSFFGLVLPTQVIWRF